MPRRALLLVSILPVWLLLAGCSTAEGQQAQALLAEADAAQARLTSSSFEGGVSFALSGQEVSLRFEGAGSGGNGYMAMSSDTLPGVDTTVIVRGDRIWVKSEGSWQELPATSAQALATPSLGPAAFAELTKHVKDVRVTEGEVVGGRPVTIVAGELDTAGLLGAMAKLSGLGGELGAPVDLDDVRSQLGDVEAVLTVDDGSKLLTSALVKLTIGTGDEAVELRLDYRLTSWNEPVEIPSGRA